MERAVLIKAESECRVEAAAADGEREVAIFKGPNAEKRALAFVCSEYYDDRGWHRGAADAC